MSTCACGKSLCPGNKTGMCRPCLNASIRREIRICKACDRSITLTSQSGYCRRHVGAFLRLQHEQVRAERERAEAERIAALPPPEPVPTRPLVRDIVTCASVISGVPERAIFGSNRAASVCRIRHACFLIAREHGHPFAQIGRVMHRDHSTVIHGADMATFHISRDPEFAALVDNIRKRCVAVDPFIRDRVEAFWMANPMPQVVMAAPVQTTQPDNDDDAPDLDDMEDLSRAVARHYAEARA